jgi:hypothetical protein
MAIRQKLILIKEALRFLRFDPIPVLLLILTALSLPGIADGPVIYSVGPEVVGTGNLPTLYAFAIGRWSNPRPKAGRRSTEIHCYKRFSFCEVADSRINDDAQAAVTLETFNIVRWDEHEMIAVDSDSLAAACAVKTLRFDFLNTQVSLGATSKGLEGNIFCEGVDIAVTSFLIGKDDYTRKEKK